MSEFPGALTAALSGRYALEREVGRGGMATVYLATDLKHHRQVAIKVLRPELASMIGPERFRREIDLAARITHPHILPLYDSGESGGLCYYVMPFVEGESLRDRLERETQLSFEDTTRVVRQVAEALDHAHAAGVIHRDIKPENILLSAGQAILSDFGIARVVGAAGEDRLTSTGMAIGTPAYMSPEQGSGRGAIDGRSDIYALGCVAYEMLAGAPPFTGPTPQSIMARHAVDPPPRLRTLRPTASEAVERVLEKAMAKIPVDRFQTPSAFADALERACAASSGEAALHPLVPRLTLRRLSIVTATLLVVALAVLGGRSVVEALRAPRLASLAVLPFDNLSGDSTQEYFSAGMHDALVGALGQVGALRVSWSRSASRYGLSQKPLAEVAAELGVDGVVTGAVLRTGDRVRLQVRLVRVRPTEELVWSRDYDRDLRDALSLQGEIARAIAGQARSDIGAGAEARLSAARPVDPATYEAYLRGMFFLDKRTPADRDRGLGYLEEAVRQNPGDAHAYAGLALGYAAVGHGPTSPPDAWQRARAAAERAVTLDPDLAEAHAALADVKLYYDHDWEGAEREFRRANELNSSLAMNHYHYSWYLNLMGRSEQAIAESRRAQEVDPLTPLFTADHGSMLIWLGQYDEPIVEARKVLDRDSTSAIGLRTLGNAYVFQGRHREGLATLERAAALNPVYRIWLGHGYVRAGRPDDARRVLAAIAAEPLTGYNALARALIHADLGELDRAFELLEYRPAHAWLPWLRTWPGKEAFRRDPRYGELMRSLRLPP